MSTVYKGKRRHKLKPYRKRTIMGTLLFLKEVTFIIREDGVLRRRGLFRCRCGKEFICNILPVKSGNNKSCGCAKGNGIEAIKKHGMSKSPEYKTWTGIKYRCYDSKAKCYKYYGGRGISVCKRWRNSFEKFYLDMGKKPSKNHSIERLNCNKNYSPKNCFWATKIVQARNTNAIITILYKGERRKLIEVCEELGVGIDRARNRLYDGKTTEQALCPTRLRRTKKIIS